MNSLDLQLLTNTLIQFFTNYNHLLPNYVPNSKKVSILLWSVKNQPNTFILKIADQKYVSDYRIDKNGGTYWKFKEVEQESKVTNSDPNSTPPSNSAEKRGINSELSEKEGVHSELSQLDLITKFQKRQEKTEQLNNYGKPSFSKPTINHSQPSESVSQ